MSKGQDKKKETKKEPKKTAAEKKAEKKARKDNPKYWFPKQNPSIIEGVLFYVHFCDPRL